MTEIVGNVGKFNEMRKPIPIPKALTSKHKT
jgi:hypothetical protein